MRAFHGKPEVKEFYLARVRAHRAADEIIHGKYWENGKGCAVGCTVHSDRYSAAYEDELGIPRLLAKIEDGIFEGMSNGKSLEWPERFLYAIPVGADLGGVWPRFAVWLMIDPTWGVLQYAKSQGGKKAIQDVADAYQGVIDGKNLKPDWGKLAAAAADAAAADAAAAYADAAAAYAAYAAYAAAAYADAAAAYADAAAAYAAYAAYAAAAAYRNNRAKCREAQAEKLLELMTQAPVTPEEVAA